MDGSPRPRRAAASIPAARAARSGPWSPRACWPRPRQRAPRPPGRRSAVQPQRSSATQEAARSAFQGVARRPEDDSGDGTLASRPSRTLRTRRFAPRLGRRVGKARSCTACRRRRVQLADGHGGVDSACRDARLARQEEERENPTRQQRTGDDPATPPVERGSHGPSRHARGPTGQFLPPGPHSTLVDSHTTVQPRKGSQISMVVTVVLMCLSSEDPPLWSRGASCAPARGRGQEGQGGADDEGAERQRESGSCRFHERTLLATQPIRRRTGRLGPRRRRCAHPGAPHPQCARGNSHRALIRHAKRLATKDLKPLLRPSVVPRGHALMPPRGSGTAAVAALVTLSHAF